MHRYNVSGRDRMDRPHRAHDMYVPGVQEWTQNILEFLHSACI